MFPDNLSPNASFAFARTSSLGSSLPIAIAGLFSGIHQGNCAVAGIGTVAKKPDQMGKAIILPAMVETYAILALLISILAVFGIANVTI